MGKKVKKKAAQNAKKEKRIPTVSPKTVSKDLIPAIDTVVNGFSVIKETKTCPHLEKGINFENFSLKMASLESHKCHDCREGVTDRRTKKGKKNKSSGSKSDSISIWVCLECGHFSCGGVGLPTTPHSHAARHSKQNRHPLVLQFANPNLRWCFLCNTIIPVQQKEDTLSEFVKALRTPSETCAEIEDTIEVKDVNTLGGYTVRGLVNLGNTCFFNSVLQNLLAMDKLRDYFLGLEGTIGPLAISLKKLFLETSQSTGGRNVINPRSFFGCVCAKAPQFRGYQQHDSHELLRCLLDGLCTEESGVRKRSQDGVQKGYPTFVDTIFGGKISSTVSCLECGHNSVVYEPYLDLSLPLPTKSSPSKRVSSVSRSKKPKLPPKKPGKFRSKSKKALDSKVDRSSMNISFSDSINSEEKPPLPDELSWLDYLESTTESRNEDLSACQDSGNSNEISWKDKIQESEVTSTMETRDQDLPAIQYSENSNKVSWKDELKVQESEDPSAIQDSGNSNKVSWKDESQVKVQEFEVTLTTESHNQDPLAIQDSGNSNEVWKDEATSTMESLNEDPSVIQDSDNSNEVSLKDEPHIKVQEFEATLTMESDNQDPSVILDSENSNEVSWKDEQKVQEFEVMSMASHSQCSSVIQDSGNSNEVSWNDEPQVKVQEFEVPSTTESLNQNTSLIQDSGNNNQVSWKDESEVFSIMASHNQEQDSGNSNKVSWKDETSVKVQEFEVSLTMESQNQDSLVIQDSGKVTQELSDFDGFGGLFDEPEFDLDVKPLSNGVEVKKGSKATSNSESEPDEFDDTNSPISLEKCLAYFTTPELLTKTEHAWQCEQCSRTILKNKLQNPVPNGGENVISSGSCDSAIDHLLPNGFSQNTESHSEDEEVVESKGVKVARDASKRILISRAPPVLTIHLKRFCQDLRGRLSKLNGHVSFRETVDLKPYMDPSCCRDRETYKYRLVGVVEHQGTMRGGHYVAYVKGGGAIWYHASDAYIREASLEEVLRCEAYILFYEAM